MIKSFVKKLVAGVMAAAIVMGSVAGATTTAEAKGVKFISKKVSTITPKVTKFKRSSVNAAQITVKIPVKKLKVSDATVKKATKGVTRLAKTVNIRYGFNNGSKFEELKATVKVAKVSGTTVTFTLKHPELQYHRNTYVSVSWSANKKAKTSATNWSKLVKLDNNLSKFYPSNIGTEQYYGKDYLVCDNCGERWDLTGYTGGDCPPEANEHAEQHWVKGEKSSQHSVYVPSPKDKVYECVWRKDPTN